MIFKMIGTSGFLTALKCTKLVFGWGPLAGLRGRTYKGREWDVKGERERKVREGTGPLTQIPGSTLDLWSSE